MNQRPFLTFTLISLSIIITLYLFPASLFAQQSRQIPPSVPITEAAQSPSPLNPNAFAIGCYTEINGDNVTDYSSADASAVQAAVDNVVPGGVIKVAGYCAGRNTRGPEAQTAYISKTLTLQGGYTNTTWLAPTNPTLYPTTLDGIANGHVLYTTAGADVTVDGLILTNGDFNRGGGIFSNGPLTVTNSMIISNVTSAGGGGIFARASLMLLDSTISHNSNSGFIGAAIALENIAGQTATIINSTIANNVATGGFGGAIGDINTAWMINITATTIVSNSAPGGSAALDLVNSNVTIASSILANNSPTNFVNAGSATISSNGYNIESGTDAGFTNTGDQQNSDPLLMPLADNGGPTWTMEPIPGQSPAIDMIPLGINGCGTVIVMDQRGNGRPEGFGCEVGAYESGVFNCWTEIDGDNVTDYASFDASAVQAAVDNVIPGGLIKVAGYCAGRNTRGPEAQTAYISKTLTLQGGYTNTMWLAPTNPTLYPTTLDGVANGHVLYTTAGADVTVDGLILTNGDFNRGGGIFSNGPLTVTNSMIISNVTSAGGGGIFARASLMLLDSTISHNSNSGFIGAAIALENIAGQTATIINSTIANNVATGGFGGAIGDINTAWMINITATTIVSNSAPGGSGALDLVNSNVTIASSILANNSPTNFVNAGSATISSNGYNIESGTDAGFTNTGDQQNSDPLLMPLADNGGPTWTMEPIAGVSPAIDMISFGVNGCGTTIVTDQRGNGRPSDSACEIGAYEIGTVCVVPMSSVTPITVTGIANDLFLDWMATPDTTEYEVWYTNNFFDPYFTQSGDCLLPDIGLSCESVAVTNWTHLNGYSDPSSNYFYKVYPVNSCGIGLAVEHKGEFDFNITPGS